MPQLSHSAPTCRSFAAQRSTKHHTVTVSKVPLAAAAVPDQVLTRLVLGKPSYSKAKEEISDESKCSVTTPTRPNSESNPGPYLEKKSVIGYNNLRNLISTLLRTHTSEKHFSLWGQLSVKSVGVFVLVGESPFHLTQTLTN